MYLRRVSGGRCSIILGPRKLDGNDDNNRLAIDFGQQFLFRNGGITVDKLHMTCFTPKRRTLFASFYYKRKPTLLISSVKRLTSDKYLIEEEEALVAALKQLEAMRRQP